MKSLKNGATKRQGWLSVTLLLSLGVLGTFSLAEDRGQRAIATETNHSPAIVAQVPAGARVLYVNPAGGQDAQGAGSEVTPYRTITYALQQAQAGDVVQLQRGTYTKDSGEVFPLTMPEGVTLVGSESDKGEVVSIIGGGTYISKTFARQNITILATENTEIRGVRVTNPNVRGTGIWVEDGNPLIKNCTFRDNNREGVFVTGTSNPRIEKNNFIKNGGNGISVASKAKGVITDNLFQDTGFGLAIGGDSTPLVSKNRIVDNEDGLYINDRAKPVIRSNVIQNNKRNGMVVTVSAEPDLGNSQAAGNNVFSGNAQFAINNATRNTIFSVGNRLDTSRISGNVSFQAPPTGGGGQTAFVDVQGYWAESFIAELAKRDIISGFPDGTFRPSDPVTRAQFAAIINKAFAPNAKNSGVAFRDLSQSFWGYQAIQTAVRGGFLKGYPDTTFRPDRQIPRVEVLVSLSNGLDFPAGDAANLNRFQDGSQVPNWAVSSVAAATQRKIVVNHPNTALLNPSRPATRAEVAAFVYQALVNSGKAEAINSPYIVSQLLR